VGFEAISAREKMVLFSTFTLSTMPMMQASTGNFSVSGVMRALDPLHNQDHFVLTGADRVDTNKVRPVPVRRSRWPGSTRNGSTVNNFLPVMDTSFLRRTTLPVTLARNIAFPLSQASIFDPRSSNHLFACRATINSSLVGIIQICTRLLGGVYGNLTFGVAIANRSHSNPNQSRSAQTPIDC